MRTAEEIRAHVKKVYDDMESRPIGSRGRGPNCSNCLEMVLEFIDSERPCPHRRVMFFQPSDAFPVTQGWYFAGLGCSDQGKVFYCPDCGEKLPKYGRP